LPERRGQGVGTLLMTRLFDLLRERGDHRTSLSVQKDNPAVRLYERLGYYITDEKLDHIGQEDYIMVKELEALTGQADEITERMDDFFAARVDIYDDHVLHDIEGLPEGYVELAKQIPSRARTLLDLGCGTGLELEEIFRIFPDMNVTGIDLSRPMLDRLSEKYGSQNVTVICASYLDYDFGEKKYDCAISFETMHHWSHEAKAGVYKNIRKALKNGGRYVECDYMVDSQSEEDRWFSESKRIRTEQNIPEVELYHLDTPCTVDNQIKLLLRAGFARAYTVWRKGGTTIIVAEK
jgi:SAM-dependent methyltransferase